MLHKPLLLLILPIILIWPLAAQAAPAKVALFLPHEPTPFWKQVVTAMNKAAKDFDIDLEVLYCGNNHLRYVEKIGQRLNAVNKPDFAIFKPYKKTTKSILTLSEEAQVPIISFNALPFQTDKYSLGEPREKYKYWLAALVPDDEQAGFELGKTLIQAAKRKGLQNQEGKITIVGLGGPIAEMPARSRMKGLLRAVEQDPAAKLLQVLHLDWKRTEVQRVFARLTQRHKNISVFWTDADVFALEVIGSSHSGLKPVSDFVTGGVDWVHEVQAHIRQGSFESSFGGHFLEGAWAMVMIHDYLQGKDFKDLGVNYLTPLGGLDRNNIDDFSALISSGGEVLDFRAFSRVINPSLKAYDFSMDTVLKQLRDSKIDKPKALSAVPLANKSGS